MLNRKEGEPQVNIERKSRALTASNDNVSYRFVKLTGNSQCFVEKYPK